MMQILRRLAAALHGRTVPPAEPWPHRLDYSRELADRCRHLPAVTDLFVDRPFDASPADTPITPPDALAPRPDGDRRSLDAVHDLEDAIAKLPRPPDVRFGRPGPTADWPVTFHAGPPADPQRDDAYISSDPVTDRMSLNVYTGEQWVRYDLFLDVPPTFGPRDETT